MHRGILELSRQSALHQKNPDSLVFICMENVIFLADAEDRKSATSVELHFCDTGVNSVSCLMIFLIFILNSALFCCVVIFCTKFTGLFDIRWF